MFDAAKIYDGFAISEGAVPISADRSPFFKRRIQAVAEAAELEGLKADLSLLQLASQTFKVLYTAGDEQHDYAERRHYERTAGSFINGKAEMRNPERIFGLIRIGGKWRFGPCEESGAPWLKHAGKPQNYSTALPTRAARAIVNIAAGQTGDGLRLIDPCCGMGTVLIEALSMGMDIRGVDINPLAVRGARSNLDYFGYPDVVACQDMLQMEGNYDIAIVDMPYNLCSVLPSDQQLSMLKGVRRLAARAVIITTMPMERLLALAGFRITDRTTLNKASFTRYITVVE